MALTNFTHQSVVPLPIVNLSNKSDDLEIFREGGEPVNNINIYRAITEPPIITNGTRNMDEKPQWHKTLHKVFSVSMGIVIIVLMLGMGSHVYWRELLGNFWPPMPVLIGMCGQFIVLPALAFVVSVLFKMDPYVALGCLIVSCSPGGTFSNFFTYWVHGDVALSLVMTTCSTILSFGTMPLNLWIYSANILGTDSQKIVIPYDNIFISLGVACGPVIIGMTIRHFSEQIANKTTKIASVIGYVMVSFNLTCIFILFWDMLTKASLLIHASVVILPLVAMLFAYVVSYITGRSHKICRTISIETASQNMPVAMGIIVLSFTDIEVRNKMLLYPSLYAIYMATEIGIAAVLFRWYYYNRQQKVKSNITEEIALKL